MAAVEELNKTGDVYENRNFTQGWNQENRGGVEVAGSEYQALEARPPEEPSVYQDLFKNQDDIYQNY